MVTHKNWLFISLYYQRTKWGLILNEAVEKFIKKVKNEKLIISYLLHLNNFRGDYVGISLHATNGKLYNLAAVADEFFKNYFIQHPGQDELIKFAPVGIFKNFPINSIQYNLHFFPFYPKQALNKKMEIELCKKLSPIMIEALGKETTDSVMIVTYCCYLHLLLLKIISPSLSNSASIIEYNLKIYSSPKVKLRESSNITTGKHVITSVIREIMLNKTVLSPEMKWTKKTSKAYHYVIAKYYKFESMPGTKRDEIFSRFSHTINQQLGISSDAGLSLMNHIYKGIKFILKEEKAEIASL